MPLLRGATVRLAFGLALGACSTGAPTPATSGDKSGGKPVAAKPTRGQSAAETIRHASTATIRAHIESLADDTYSGRRPGTEGGRQTQAYLEAQMRHLGLAPAGQDGGFRQTVPMRGVSLDLGAATFSVTGAGGKAQTLAPKSQVVVTSFGEPGEHTARGELVFVGYGITAPEYEWDDYQGVDVTDKIVVALVGDPPVTDGRFHGKAMTYYGRWSYKFERALQAGAAGCVVVHEKEPASYGWHVVESSWSGERFGLRNPDGTNPQALALQGWLHRDAANALAQRTGSSLAQWHTDALTPGFTAKPLGVHLDATYRIAERELAADNLIGKIAGTDKADEAVFVTAHWDHLGLARDATDGDGIFNGAIDNASGIAGMLAAAAELKARAAAGQPPRRTIVFLATTAEEQGLLGSRYYANNPIVPLDKIIAVTNLDSMNVHGKTKSVVVVGSGQSTLEDTLEEVVGAQGRRTVPDERPESGGYYRSDHFSFARKGVPALYFRGSHDFVEGGTEAGAKIAAMRAKHYHTTADEYDASWSLEGTLQDVEALVDLVSRVANAEQPPSWKPASEFAAQR